MDTALSMSSVGHQSPRESVEGREVRHSTSLSRIIDLNTHTHTQKGTGTVDSGVDIPLIEGNEQFYLDFPE